MKIININGPINSGKTTVSKNLSEQLEDALFCNSIGKSFFEFAEQVNCPCLDRFYYACNSPETMSVFFRRTNQLIRSVVADRNYRKTLICSFQPKVYRYITNGNQI